MPVRHLPFLLFVLFFVACSPGGETPAPTAQNPNVLIIVCDALRQDVLGCYGGEARTPNIDRLAAAGALFENAYTNSAWTAPSVVNMFTGRYATTYGTQPFGPSINILVPNSELVLSEVLKQTGYQLIAGVENVHAVLHNCLQGFGPLPRGRAADPDIQDTIARIVGRDLSSELAARKEFKDVYDYVAWLLTTPENQSFFSLYWMLDPHEPYSPVDHFKTQIDIDSTQLPQPQNFYEQAKVPIWDLSELEQDYLKKLYVAEVESVDERVGFIIGALRQRNLLDNTYIVLTADHGETFGEHGKWGHHAYYYDPVMRVPLIIAGPNVVAGVRPTGLVSLVDLMPTLTDLLGAEYMHDMQGQSFRSMLRGEPPGERSVYFTNVLRKKVDYLMHADGLREDNYKLIAWPSGELELYDLETDPEEHNDIAVGNPDIVTRMYDKILTQRGENAIRWTRNMALVSETPPVSEEQLRKTGEQLRALGYIK